MKNTILIYNDSGTFDIQALKKELQSFFLKKKISITTINSTEIIQGQKLNEKSVLALIIPGGFASKYFEKLGKTGNNKIQNYVKNGGIYLGICGGAYYACKRIEFEMDIPELKKESTNTLNLVKTLAKGTLHKELKISPFSNSTQSQTIVNIEEEKTKTLYPTIYHGGPVFELVNKEYKIIANYKLNSKKKLPAIIEKQYGKGKVILSGVHFEYNLAQLLQQKEEEIKLKEKERQTFFNKLMQKIR